MIFHQQQPILINRAIGNFGRNGIGKEAVVHLRSRQHACRPPARILRKRKRHARADGDNHYDARDRAQRPRKRMRKRRFRPFPAHSAGKLLFKLPHIRRIKNILNLFAHHVHFLLFDLLKSEVEQRGQVFFRQRFCAVIRYVCVPLHCAPSFFRS